MSTIYPGREDEHDLGGGHSFVWLRDRTGQTIGLIEHHPKGQEARPDALHCGGYIAWVPRDEQQSTTPWIARHQLVAGGPGNEASLTITPSLACRTCTSHGFIRNGRWQSA